MHLIQILLPLYDNGGRKFGRAAYVGVKAQLSARFQGLTAYSRVAAEGLWRVGKSVRRDDIIVYEVMAKSLNRNWWAKYRKHLEAVFRQESIIIRAQRVALM